MTGGEPYNSGFTRAEFMCDRQAPIKVHASARPKTTTMTPFLSAKAIPVRERLIFALDVSSAEDAKQLVETLGDEVLFYKLGLELFMAGGYFELIDWLRARGKQVFVDLKFFDVPETVASAVRQLTHRGATFATVHGNDAIMRAAVRE